MRTTGISVFTSSSYIFISCGIDVKSCKLLMEIPFCVLVVKEFWRGVYVYLITALRLEENLWAHTRLCAKKCLTYVSTPSKRCNIYIYTIYISLFLQACLKACTYIDPPEMICQGTTIAINVGNDEWAD